MAALPKFSFSGWTSQSLSPKVNPATIPQPTSTGLVATTNAANTNLPAWLQAEVDKLNQGQALRNQMTGQVMQQPTSYDPNLGVAAVTAARAQYNTQINQMNEQARLANLVQQRRNLQVGGSPGLYDLSGATGLDRQIRDFQQINLPLAAGRSPSGWVQPTWAQPRWN